MNIEKTSTIQVSGCQPSELDSIDSILRETGSERPVIDDEFIMTDLGVIKEVVSQHGDTDTTGMNIFMEVLRESENHPEIAYDEKVMFTR